MIELFIDVFCCISNKMQASHPRLTPLGTNHGRTIPANPHIAVKIITGTSAAPIVELIEQNYSRLNKNLFPIQQPSDDGM